MYQFICTLGAALLAASGTAGAAVIYVDADATGLNNGSSWANAYTDLVDALAAAVPGDDIWIAEGVYTPASASARTTTFAGVDLCVYYFIPSPCTTSFVRTRTFAIEAGVDVLGGFSGTESTPEQRVLDASATILSGDLSQNDDPADPSLRAENVVQVVIVDGDPDETTVVDRLTISGGQASLPSSFSGDTGGYLGSGGGMAIVRGNTELNQITLRDNYAENCGGAVLILSAGSTAISGCTFENNVAGSLTSSDAFGTGGGAIWHGWNVLNESYGPLTITDSFFYDNTSATFGTVGVNDLYGSGGAIQSDRPPAGEFVPGTLVISGSVFSGSVGGQEIGCGNNLCQGASTIDAVTLTLSDSVIENGTGGVAVRVYVEAVITNTRFESNLSLRPSAFASPSGLWPGALDVRGESPFFVTEATVINCDFIDNTGAFMGGAYVEGDATVRDSTFFGNTAYEPGSEGGGLFLNDGDGVLDRCEFRDNSSDFDGGGLYARGARQISNSVFEGNSAGRRGGGLYIGQVSPAGGLDRVVVNSTFSGNSAGIEGGGIFRNANGINDPTVEIRNTILWGNSDSFGTLSGQIAGTALPGLDVAFSLVEDPASSFGGAGMLYADPLFLDPTNGDVRIEINSPARETGDNAALDLDGDSVVDITEDLPGGARVQGPGGGIVDMGSYEECFADYNGDGLVNFFDQSDFIADYNAQNPRADLFPPGGDGMFNFFDFSEWLTIYNGGAPCN